MAKVEVTNVVKEITLTLTEAEARSLYALTILTGGSPDNSPRKHIDGINEAFKVILGNFRDNPEYVLAKDSSNVFFRDYGKGM
jgi:hypothetical protein